MLDFFIKDFKLSHGFKAKNGLIIGHIGSFFIFYVAFFCYVWYHGLFVLCLGWCECFCFLVISICTELLCFGRGIGITCS